MFTKTQVKHASLDAFRMAQWLVVALAFYFLTFDLGLQETHPALQSTLYLMAQITVRAWIGYWVARTALGKLPQDGTAVPITVLARAVIMGCVILTSR